MDIDYTTKDEESTKINWDRYVEDYNRNKKLTVEAVEKQSKVVLDAKWGRKDSSTREDLPVDNKERLDTHSEIRTVSGIYVDVLNPDPDTILIEDIAHALSMQCRWGGHVKNHFNIAQHSILVAMGVNHYKRLEGLLHDASEAYLCDIPSPIKRHLTNYKEIENNLMQVIAKKFKFDWPLSEEVHRSDREMLELEWEVLVLGTKDNWSLGQLTQKEAYTQFLEMFEKYYDRFNNGFDKKKEV